MTDARFNRELPKPGPKEDPTLNAISNITAYLTSIEGKPLSANNRHDLVSFKLALFKTKLNQERTNRLDAQTQQLYGEVMAMLEDLEKDFYNISLKEAVMTQMDSSMWNPFVRKTHVQSERRRMFERDKTGGPEMDRLRQLSESAREMYDNNSIVFMSSLEPKLAALYSGVPFESVKLEEKLTLEEMDHLKRLTNMIVASDNQRTTMDEYDALKKLVPTTAESADKMVTEAENYMLGGTEQAKTIAFIDQQWARIDAFRASRGEPPFNAKTADVKKRIDDAMSVYEKNFSNLGKDLNSTLLAIDAVYAIQGALNDYDSPTYQPINTQPTGIVEPQVPTIPVAPPQIVRPSGQPPVRPPVVTVTPPIVAPVQPQVVRPPVTPPQAPQMTVAPTAVPPRVVVLPTQPSPVQPTPMPTITIAPPVAPVQTQTVITPPPEGPILTQTVPVAPAESILKPDGTIRIPAINASVYYTLPSGKRMPSIDLSDDISSVEAAGRFEAKREGNEWVITPAPGLRAQFTVRADSKESTVDVSEVTVNKAAPFIRKEAPATIVRKQRATAVASN